MRVLLLKPFQPIDLWLAAPPLGLLCIAAALRKDLPGVDVRVVDMNVRGLGAQWLHYAIRQFRPDVVGVSALNFQLPAAREIASIVQQADPKILSVLGGPVTHHRSAELLAETDFDWVFEGEAERTFTRALEAYRKGADPAGIPGLSFRKNGQASICTSRDVIEDPGNLPLPAWDLCEFELYAAQPNGNLIKKHAKYAYLYTSRGCPYRCAYCHDIFGKKFHSAPADRVLEEIELLHTKYGIREFHIIDDIFNFDRKRMAEVFTRVQKRFGKKLAFCFPNGLRADILTPDLIELMAEAGTISIAVAIETSSKRLQRLMSKHLQIEKAVAAVECAHRHGIVVKGFFMLGFPSETPDEMEQTVRLALGSKLTIAHFFAVTPQPGSPLFELAQQEISATNGANLRQQYNATQPWYEQAYGFALGSFIRRAYRRFYLQPSRIWRIVSGVPWRSYAHALPVAMRRLTGMRPGLPKSRWYTFAETGTGPLVSGLEFTESRGFYSEQSIGERAHPPSR
ncbi:MAG: B12-binding domain-containing radical SAM protein [Spirochaetota bacterium]